MEGGWKKTRGRQRGREVERGRPRTRRIIARVILPRCAPALLFFPHLSALPSCLVLSTSRSCVRTYVRTYVCTRELASACERSSSVRRSRSRGGRQGRPGTGWRGTGEQGKGVEALEEEVRGQPHSRRGRRDAHRATPTRKVFSTKPLVFFTFFLLLLLVPFLSSARTSLPVRSRFFRFFPLASTKRAEDPPFLL